MNDYSSLHDAEKAKKEVLRPIKQNLLALQKEKAEIEEKVEKLNDARRTLVLMGFGAAMPDDAVEAVRASLKKEMEALTKGLLRWLGLKLFSPTWMFVVPLPQMTTLMQSYETENSAQGGHDCPPRRKLLRMEFACCLHRSILRLFLCPRVVMTYLRLQNNLLIVISSRVFYLFLSINYITKTNNYSPPFIVSKYLFPSVSCVTRANWMITVVLTGLHPIRRPTFV